MQSASSIRLHKARIHVHATTPAIPQIARRSYRSRTRVRCRTSVLSISPKESDALEGNESAACDENLFNGRTRLEFRLVYTGRPSSARAIILARIIDCTVLLRACCVPNNETSPDHSRIKSPSRTSQEQFPLKLLLAKRDARNRRSFDTDFFDAECRNRENLRATSSSD